MEIRPSALCCRIREPLFIRIRTIRKSGYFARVLELRPVSRRQESSPRSCCSSRSKLICSRGSANPGNRFNASMPSPGWQVLIFVTMMNTFLLCVSYANTCRPLSSNYGAHNACLKFRRAQKTMIDDMLPQDWSTLHSHSIDLKFRCSIKVSRDEPVKRQGRPRPVRELEQWSTLFDRAQYKQIRQC